MLGMLFDYPSQPHRRKHGPEGYTDSGSFKDWLRDEFSFRCAYCLERERWYPNGQDAFSVDHILPRSDPSNSHLLCEYSNLVYSCLRGNSAKQETLVLDPTQDSLGDHVVGKTDGTVEPTSPQGRAMIKKLGLMRPNIVAVRQYYLRLVRLRETYPEDEE